MGTEYEAGVYELRLLGKTTKAKCLDGGWTVIQSRGQFGNPTQYFYREWGEYVQGFGTPGIIVELIAVEKFDSLAI